MLIWLNIIQIIIIVNHENSRQANIYKWNRFYIWIYIYEVYRWKCPI